MLVETDNVGPREPGHVNSPLRSSLSLLSFAFASLHNSPRQHSFASERHQATTNIPSGGTRLTNTMTPLRSHPLPLFLLSLLSPLTIAQSFTGGDLSSLPGPYGIPPSTLLEAADAPISYLAVPITGYNTSLPAGSTTATGSGNSLPGWMLAIAVSADIPLVGATDKGINRKDFMEGTALSVTPPAEMEEPTWRRGDWRVCAVVFTGGLIGGNGDGGNGTGAGTGTGGNATERNGQCGRWISQGCIQRLQAGSVTAKGNGTGTGTGGGCVDLEIPEVCQGYLGEGKGVAYGELLVVFLLFWCCFAFWRNVVLGGGREGRGKGLVLTLM